MLRSWLKRRLKGITNEKLVIDPDEETLSGLNLKEVLDAHEAWKDKLEKELSGVSDEPIDADIIASDCQCILGKWLHGKGKKDYSKLPEYKPALNAHADFHKAAADVVIQHQANNTEQAKQLLRTSFRTASNDNQLELVRLFTAAKERR